MRFAAVVLVMLAACSSAPPADPPPPSGAPAGRNRTRQTDDLSSAPAPPSSADAEEAPLPASSGSASPSGSGGAPNFPAGCTNLAPATVKLAGGTAPRNEAGQPQGGTIPPGTFVEDTRWFFGQQYTETTAANWTPTNVVSMRFSADGTIERVWTTTANDVMREAGTYRVEGNELVLEISCRSPATGLVTYVTKAPFTAASGTITFYGENQGVAVEQTYAKK